MRKMQEENREETDNENEKKQASNKILQKTIKIKFFFRKQYYRFAYDHIYSFYYSIKELKDDFISLMNEFKKPKTWLSILYVVSFYAIFKRNLELFKWIIPLIIAVYIMRQRIDGAYKRDIKKNAFLTNNEIILKEEYKKYQRDCYFSHKEPLEFGLWKENEIKQLKTYKS